MKIILIIILVRCPRTRYIDAAIIVVVNADNARGSIISGVAWKILINASILVIICIGKSIFITIHTCVHGHCKYARVANMFQLTGTGMVRQG